jgi:hypothetical protein
VVVSVIGGGNRGIRRKPYEILKKHGLLNVASLDQQRLGSVVVCRPFISQINVREKPKE